MLRDMKMRIDNRAHEYINRIRNKRKKEYAKIYLRYIKFGEMFNDSDFNDLSFMAQQAVRMNIDSYFIE